MKKDSFGINMKKYCREHEEAVKTAISEDRITEEALTVHLEMIARIQHERLVHLMVTVMCVVCELFFVQLVMLHPELGLFPTVIMLTVAILLVFYFYHYFFLENTVQRWYVIADEIRRKAG